MNILPRLQLVAHGEPSDVIELSSVSNPAADKTGRGPGAASFLRYAKLQITSRLCGLLSQRKSPCTRSSKTQQ
jgi:hypothetical protein